ncbi:MAG: inositol-1-monophosphatase [Pseudomonadota bacterium]|mgnify:CR=1 FL=1
MQPLLNIAVSAARKAGNIIVRSMDRIDSLQVDTKSHNDFVSEVDHRAEQEIIHTIRKAYPHHAVLAEESGEQGDSEYTWVIDPLDGTTNFLHGFPQYAVSIGLRHKGRFEVAVVYDPVRPELFTAIRGGGAQLEGRRIRISKARGLEGSLLGTGFPFKDQTHVDAYLGMFKAVLPQAAGIRRAGSAALDLAYVAAGRLDGFWEIGLQPWDMAAGILLIKEAGGMVGDFRGGDQYYETGNLVTGNAKVYAALLQAFAPYVSPALQAELEMAPSPLKSVTMSLDKPTQRARPRAVRRPRKE